MSWRQALLGLIGVLFVAGCAAAGYQARPGDQSGPVHGESGGAGGGGAGM